MCGHSIVFETPFRSYLAVAVVLRVCLILFLLYRTQYFCKKTNDFRESPDNLMTSPYFRDISVRGIKYLLWYSFRRTCTIPRILPRAEELALSARYITTRALLRHQPYSPCSVRVRLVRFVRWYEPQYELDTVNTSQLVHG